MAQNTPSATATRNTVPGTANEKPVAPALFTSKREYIPDAKRVTELLATPEMEQARAFFDDGDFAGARREAKRVLRSKDSSTEAKMEAGDLLDRTGIDQGPIAAAVAFLILFGLMLMYFATNGR
jgi:Flp pilus assembly protein TadD